jgi:SAM-dependent methyltransferase
MKAFTPLLSTTDWNEEWKELQKARRHADSAEYWDKRASTYSSKDSPNSYVRQFIEFAAIRPGETIFDMGCGTGSLAVPLGAEGHKVVAADFSQGMLDQMERRLQEANIHTVFAKHMSWEDDWAAFGVRPGMTDIALASRSIATADLRESLLRLTEIARRRVCITLSTGSSPRIDERMLAAVGLPHIFGRDYWYAFNILVSEGITPEVRYIRSTREDTFETPEEAHEKMSRMIDDVSATIATEAERARAHENLTAWLNDNLVPNENAGKPDVKGIIQGPWRLREARVISWAFMAWDKQ